MQKFRGFSILFLFLVFTFLQLPFVLANPVKIKKLKNHFTNNEISNKSANNTIHSEHKKSVYDSLQLADWGLSHAAFEYARQGFDELVDEGKVHNDSILTIADFSLPSSEKRLFVIDLKNYTVLFNTYVAHGQNSGKAMASSFSNANSSHKSSLGFYVTGQTYQGKNGYSLQLIGLENGINDNAMERTIVMHGADYVSAAFVRMQGYIGRSWGCPAIPKEKSQAIINTIKNGSCLFIYHPQYIAQSTILQS